MKCINNNGCGLVQLSHSYDLNEMYGDNYGYRSGLNASMTKHLREKILKIESFADLSFGDLVLDIGSNDATSLKSYSVDGLKLVGIDPTGLKFKSYYTDNITLISDFFSAEIFKKQFGNEKAKIVTSFSMFYDLEDPLSFMREIYSILRSDGYWIFEQSYMPNMLNTNSFDTVCHEHIEFYGLSQILYMTEIVGFDIIDVETNFINGGSFSVVVKKKETSLPSEQPSSVKVMLQNEKNKGYNSLDIYKEFSNSVAECRENIISFVDMVNTKGKLICAIGASTKGNVLLQYCKLDSKKIPFIGEVNKDKFGLFTPGTLIPIIPEDDLLEKKPDYLIVLPWHFKDFFIKSNKFKGIKLVFPLPILHVVEL